VESNVRSSEWTESVPVLAGILADDPARAEVLVPIIEGLGWTALRFDASVSPEVLRDEISLLILSLADVAQGRLELVASIGVHSRASLLVISDNRNPQVIADTLRMGADDYLISPFATAELVARMRSLITRVWPTTERRVGNGLKFDFRERSIATGPYAVQFTPLEWDILNVLLEHDGLPVSSDAIASDTQLRQVQTSTIPTIISRIRRKLEASHFHAISVTTVQNRGYVAQFRRSSDQQTTNRNEGANRNSSAEPEVQAESSNGTHRARSIC